MPPGDGDVRGRDGDVRLWRVRWVVRGRLTPYGVSGESAAGA